MSGGRQQQDSVKDLEDFPTIDRSLPIIKKYAVLVDSYLTPWKRIPGVNRGMGATGMITPTLLKAMGKRQFVSPGLAPRSPRSPPHGRAWTAPKHPPLPLHRTAVHGLPPRTPPLPLHLRQGRGESGGRAWTAFSLTTATFDASGLRPRMPSNLRHCGSRSTGVAESTVRPFSCPLPPADHGLLWARADCGRQDLFPIRSILLQLV